MARKRMRQKAEKGGVGSVAGDAASASAGAADAAAAGAAAADEDLQSKSREHVAKIRGLEQEVERSKEKVNNLVTLLQYMTEDEPRTIKATMHALRRLFTCGCAALCAVTAKFMRAAEAGDSNAGPPVGGKKQDAATVKAQEIFDQWVCKQYQEFKRLLLQHLHHQDDTVQVLALVILMQLVKEESASGFSMDLFGRVVRTMYTVSDTDNSSGENLKVFVSQFLNEYDDVRYHTLKCLKVLLGGWHAEPADANTTAVQRVVATLLTVSMPAASAESLSSFWVTALSERPAKKAKAAGAAPDKVRGGRVAQARSHRKAFGDCWMQLLRLPDISPMVYRRILLNMHSQILPHITHPLLLSDFLTDAYNQGGALSMLALHGLFILMSKHGLEYPNFYPRLYALLNADVLQVGHRDQFFQLLDLFLTSR